MHESLPSYTPFFALTQNLAAAATAAHHADGGVCPVVLAPIIAEYIIAEFGSDAQKLLEGCEDTPGAITTCPAPAAACLQMSSMHGRAACILSI